MKDAQREILLIAQEECAEVTQAISKVFRFGIDAEYNGTTNRKHLEMELGDLLCMIDLMLEQKMVDRNEIIYASGEKYKKLKKWSNIFGEKE